MPNHNIGQIDHWISEYPTLKRHILRNAGMFMRLEPPRGWGVSDEQWMEIVQRIQSAE